MAQTQHRTMHFDRRSNLDEVEQAMTTRDHRAKMKQAKEYEFDEEEYGNYAEDIRHFLGKMK